MGLKITKEYSFSKVGVNEVKGLLPAMAVVVAPIVKHLKQSIYWDDNLGFGQSEYKSRDGFIPYSHNCSGLELCTVIPSCESDSFSFLEFGEWDGTHYCDDLCPQCKSDNNANEGPANNDGSMDMTCHDCSHQCLNECNCSDDPDGHYDAKLRVWLKFEGIENGVMSFYLVLSGGNRDAPYFREKYSSTYFESSFEAKTISEFKRLAKREIAKLIKAMPLK